MLVESLDPQALLDAVAKLSVEREYGPVNPTAFGPLKEPTPPPGAVPPGGAPAPPPTAGGVPPAQLMQMMGVGQQGQQSPTANFIQNVAALKPPQG